MWYNNAGKQSFYLKTVFMTFGLWNYIIDIMTSINLTLFIVAESSVCFHWEYNIPRVSGGFLTALVCKELLWISTIMCVYGTDTYTLWTPVYLGVISIVQVQRKHALGSYFFYCQLMSHREISSKIPHDTVSFMFNIALFRTHLRR